MKSQSDFKTIVEYKEYLRTHFAAMAMQGMLANSALNYGDEFIAITEKAVIAADMLLSELEKPNQNGQ